jgi:hypothetical protein
MAVPELDKPNGVRCEHLTASGCGIYDSRPPTCEAFRCEWLAGQGGLSTRPDRTHAVLTFEDGGFGTDGLALIVYTEPGNERWRKSKYVRRRVEALYNKGRGALVVSGSGEEWIVNPKGPLARVLKEAGRL